MNPGVGIVFVTLTVGAVIALSFAFRYKWRELQHRERMAALEKGLALPIGEDSMGQPVSWPAGVFLLRGLTWLFAGLGLSIFLLGMSLTTRRDVPAAFRVERAMEAKTRGATEEQVHEIMADREPSRFPLGVALIGLIPMGVGLAYLITYRKEFPVRP